MLGKLTEPQIEKLLHDEVIGRIGCCRDGFIYVVPINYAYDGEFIYAHSKDGLKIKMMRQNPEICFEIDTYKKNGDRKSVILWGTYEELKTIKSQRSAMKVFTAQMARQIATLKAMPSHGFVKGVKKGNDPFKSVVFRIRIREKTGRFEVKQDYVRTSLV
jgi:nitroimidazol reductase NimA-like FMN-containing flavoprotein (pyridoxamine 5'-phosphate oxidase superfamily)